MSFVTDVILTFSCLEDDEEARIKEVNSFTALSSRVMDLASIEEPNMGKESYAWYGGSKYFHSYVYMGAFNYLKLEEFLLHISTKVNWEEPRYVQLFIKLESEYTYRVYTNAGATLAVDSLKT